MMSPCPIHTFDAGFVIGIRLQPASALGEFKFHAAGKQRRDADSDEANFSLDGFVGRTFDGESDLLAVFLGAGHLGADQGPDTRLGEAALQHLRDFIVLHRKQAILHFDKGHLRAVGIEEISEFSADSARTDDDDAFGLLRQDHGVMATHDGLAIEGQTGHGASLRAGADEDLASLVRFLFPVLVGDFHLASGRNGAGAADVVDFVLLQQELDPASKLVRDLTATANDRIPVKAQAFDLQAKLSRSMGDGMIDFGVFQQRLGRDTAPVQASAARAIIFHHGDFLAELGSANCSDVARRPAADDDEVVVHSFFSGGIKAPLKASQALGASVDADSSAHRRR